MTQYAGSLEQAPKTILDLQAMKQTGEKISCLTAYDAAFSTLFSRAGVDVLLVGDSLGMVVQGHSSTLPVTMQDMLYHTQLVSRGNNGAFIIADLPFMSTSSHLEAAKNAALLIQQGTAQMVKLEGARVETIQFMVQQGIPVCAHLGLLPQSINQLGKYSVQGKSSAAAKQLLQEAIAVEAAGAQLLILECIPATLAKEISQTLKIPVIGIGAGIDCDGQVLVAYDMLGLNLGQQAKFTKNFMHESGSIFNAVLAFVEEVKAGTFPSLEESYQ
ncbi:MAG: 3-methyl-2-oxobutanoate hydroxymethyltransferase [Methyloprofundus sp.]|nr:3-methyl-2-oxobutanoate hydroxymethyltransferase [Methyloprofundus sp.]